MRHAALLLAATLAACSGGAEAPSDNVAAVNAEVGNQARALEAEVDARTNRVEAAIQAEIDALANTPAAAPAPDANAAAGNAAD